MLKLNAEINEDENENFHVFSSIGKTAYVLINPHFDYKLERNDIIYILRPGNISIN